jgi:hypothetical protein
LTPSSSPTGGREHIYNTLDINRGRKHTNRSSTYVYYTSHICTVQQKGCHRGGSEHL